MSELQRNVQYIHSLIQKEQDQCKMGSMKHEISSIQSSYIQWGRWYFDINTCSMQCTFTFTGVLLQTFFWVLTSKIIHDFIPEHRNSFFYKTTTKTTGLTSVQRIKPRGNTNNPFQTVKIIYIYMHILISRHS